MFRYNILFRKGEKFIKTAHFIVPYRWYSDSGRHPQAQAVRYLQGQIQSGCQWYVKPTSDLSQ